MDFEHLLQRIVSTSAYLQERALVAVNRATTIRNWCFGLFIVEYEQNGEDRAQYGEQLIERLSTSLSGRGVKAVSATALRLCRQFYLIYPEIHQTLSDEFDILLRTAISGAVVDIKPSIRQTLSDELAVSDRQLGDHLKRLMATLSFSHFVEIIQLDEPLKWSKGIIRP